MQKYALGMYANNMDDWAVAIHFKYKTYRQFDREWIKLRFKTD